MEQQQQAHIVIVPSPGMGHLIPLVEFAKVLVSRFNFSVSIILPTTAQPTKAQLSLLTSLPSSISHTFLEPVDPAHLPDGVAHEVTITLTHTHSLSAIRAELGSLTQRGRVVALVTDLFGTVLYDVARELGIKPYMYFTTTAMCLLFFFYLQRLDKTVSCEYRDMPEPLVMPGCVPLHGKDFVDPVQDRKDVAYRVILDHIEKYKLSDGIFVNSFLDLDSGPIRALEMEDPKLPPIYPVGPIIQSGSNNDIDGSDCLRWLDKQPSKSVLFVSFGSGGTLSTHQLNELAIGLEKSGHRFLWVVRSPNDHSSNGTFFSVQSGEGDSFGFLPSGFVERIKDRGLLVPSWAPQVNILSHGSTGGFLTHCGWNSTLESIVYGVPLIVWPLYAEQKMNAVLLNEGLKVALRPKANEVGIVEANEITKVVKDLLEGEQGKIVRHQMNNLSDLAKKTTSPDGNSTKVHSKVVSEWNLSEN